MLYGGMLGVCMHMCVRAWGNVLVYVGVCVCVCVCVFFCFVKVSKCPLLIANDP